MGWESRCPVSGRVLPVHVGRIARDEEMPDEAFQGPGWPDLPVGPTDRDWGHVTVITPYIEPHERMLERCRKTVDAAWEYSQGPFSSMNHACIVDANQKGPGWGRNQAIEDNPDADWYFYVDADDMMKEFAFEALAWAKDEVDVYWGVTEHRAKIDDGTAMSIRPRALRNTSFSEFASFGFDGGGGYGVGHFVRGDLQRRFKWFLNAVYEDIEMFLCLMAHGSFTRLPFPLVTIDKRVRSSSTPDKRAVHRKDVWPSIQNFWRRNGRRPLSPDLLRFRNECEKMGEFYGG